MIRTRSLAAPGLAASGLLAGLLFAAALPAQQPSRLSLVDPLVGTTNGGNTTPGAQVPFGFVSFGPDTTTDSNFTNGYNPAAEITGFSCTHESGTGGEGKYGNFRTTPTVGTLSPRNLLYAWTDERATPGYYAVTLITPAPPSTPTQQVRTELTASRLVAYSRYTFPAHTQANILLDVSSRIRLKGGRSGVPSESMAATNGAVTLTDARHATGFITITGGWNPAPYTLYFAAELSRPATSMGTWDEHRTYPNRLHAEGIDQTPHSPESYRNQLGAYFTFASADAPHHDAPCRLLPQHRKGPPEPRCRVPPHLRRRPRPGRAAVDRSALPDRHHRRHGRPAQHLLYSPVPLPHHAPRPDRPRTSGGTTSSLTHLTTRTITPFGTPSAPCTRSSPSSSPSARPAW